MHDLVTSKTGHKCGTALFYHSLYSQAWGGGANKESATVSFLQLSHRYTKTRMTQSDALAFEKPGN